MKNGELEVSSGGIVLPVIGEHGSIDCNEYHPGEQRDERLDRYFGSDKAFFLTATEAFCHKLSANFDRCGYALAELSNGGVYIFPSRDEVYSVFMPNDEDPVEVSSRMLGLLASMQAIDWLYQRHGDHSQWGAACFLNSCSLYQYLVEDKAHRDVLPIVIANMPRLARRTRLH